MVRMDNVLIGRFCNTFVRLWISRNGLNVTKIVMIRIIMRSIEDIPLDWNPVSEASQKFLEYKRNSVKMSAILTMSSTKAGQLDVQ